MFSFWIMVVTTVPAQLFHPNCLSLALLAQTVSRCYSGLKCVYTALKTAFSYFVLHKNTYIHSEKKIYLKWAWRDSNNYLQSTADKNEPFAWIIVWNSPNFQLREIFDIYIYIVLYSKYEMRIHLSQRYQLIRRVNFPLRYFIVEGFFLLINY